MLANVSPAWYVRLEQWSKVRVSAEILDSVAAALRLDAAEKRYLRALGADPPLSTESNGGTHDEVVDLVSRLVRSLDDDALPVYAVDARG